MYPDHVAGALETMLASAVAAVAFFPPFFAVVAAFLLRDMMYRISPETLLRQFVVQTGN